MTAADKNPRLYWEDLPAGHRREFGGHVVTRDEILAFARQFDPQPFHVDEEAALGSLFGALCASGWHTCALVMRMMCDDYLLDAASLGSPGLDSLRWLKPVYAGDTLRVRLDVLEARPMGSRPHVGLTRSRWEVINQRGDTVLTMEGWGMFRRRPTTLPAEVLAFWFGTPPYASREAWFRKSDAFDEEIRSRFGALVEAAIAGALPAAWHDDAQGRLAQLLLLDQFTRNIFRGTARAFAGDPRALQLALAMIERRDDQAFAAVQRTFVYLPLEHAEDLGLQRRSEALFTALAAEDPALAAQLPYAVRHREIIERFGRFPHRNAALGRASTPEEVEFLQQPGSSF